MEGLVIGPIDKNIGECSMVCPVLYQRALDKLYTEETGYKEVHPHKIPKKLDTTLALKHVLQKNIPPLKNKKGDE